MGRPSVGIILLLPSLLLPSAARGAPAASPTERRIITLLNDALSASDGTKADALLDQARKQLAGGRGRLDAAIGSLLAGEIDRTQGVIAMHGWQRDAGRGGLRDRARQCLERARASYDQALQQAEQRMGEREDQLGDRPPEEDPRWNAADVTWKRAQYRRAWTLYRLGLVESREPERRRCLEQGTEAFAVFTESGWRAHPIGSQCFLGQALCLFELGEYEAVIALLQPALATSDWRNAFDGADALHADMTRLVFKTLRKQQRYEQMEQEARKYFEALPADAALESRDLRLALERARNLVRLSDVAVTSDGRKELRQRLERLIEPVAVRGEPWLSELSEIVGDEMAASNVPLILAHAHEQFRAKQYASAAATAERGLAVAVADTPSALLADLRFARAAAHWNGKAWSAAFEAAWEFLRQHPDDRRVTEHDLCGMAIQAGLNGRKDHPPLSLEKLFTFFRFAERRFQEHPEIQRLPWYRGHLLLSAGKLDEAERELSPISPVSPVYRPAQYGLAMAAYQQATRVRAEAPTVAARHLRRAGEAIRAFVESAEGQTLNAEQRAMAEAIIDLAVTIAQEQLRRQPPDQDQALTLLNQIEKFDGELGRGAVSKGRPLRVLATYLQEGPTSEVLQSLEGLLLTGSDQSPIEVVSVIADKLEQQRQQAEDGDDAETAQRLDRILLRIYAALLAQVRGQAGPDPERQEVAIRRRWAAVLLRLGRHAEALPHYEFLRRRVPDDQSADVCRGLAMGYEDVGRHDQALPLWRRLAKGLEAKSDGWYEARYHLVHCYLRQGDRERAKKALAYFRLLCPTVDIPLWQDRFQELERIVESQ